MMMLSPVRCPTRAKIMTPDGSDISDNVLKIKFWRTCQRCHTVHIFPNLLCISHAVVLYFEALFCFCFCNREFGCPVLHLSPIASGRAVSRDDRLRQMFSSKCGALVFDSELDAVLDSVLGNCRDSFLCLRGVADYRGDGSRRSEWQPYAALAAASVMKAVICAMEPPQDN